MTKNKTIYILAVVVFLVFNVLNTYLASTNILNDYLVVFPRTFLGELNAILGNLTIAAFFYLVTILIAKKRKNQIFMMLMITLLLNVAVYGLMFFNQYYNVSFSLAGLDVMRNPTDGLGTDLMLQTIREFFTEWMFLVLIPFIIMLVLYIVYDKKAHQDKPKRNLTFAKRSLAALLVILFALVGNIVIFDLAISNKWQSNVARSTFVTQNMGAYPFFIYQLAGSDFMFNPNDFFTDAEFEETLAMFNTNQARYQNLLTGELFSNRLTRNQLHENIVIDPSLADGDDLHGILAGRNLVLIHMESLSTYLYTLFPFAWHFLPMLLAESLVFDNFRHTVGIGTSADAEFTVLTGLYSTGNTNLYWDFEDTPFFVESLPNLFRANNYYALAVQADNPLFYNRINVYPKLMHFNSFFTLTDFRRDFPNINEEYHHPNPWVTDFAMTRKVRQSLQNPDQPMFVFPKTMMPHVPFAHNPFETQAYAMFSQLPWFADLSLVTQRYLKFIPYVDEVIRSFFFDIISGANQTPQNTAFLFYGDHTAAINDVDVATMFNNPNMTRSEIIEANLQTMAWLYVPGSEVNENGINRGLITGHQPLLRSQADIFRTMVELFDIPTTTPYFGVNMLSNELTFAITTRFFAISANKIDQNGLQFVSFLNTNPRFHYGDFDLVTDQFRHQVELKKQLHGAIIYRSRL